MTDHTESTTPSILGLSIHNECMYRVHLTVLLNIITLITYQTSTHMEHRIQQMHIYLHSRTAKRNEINGGITHEESYLVEVAVV